MVLPKPPLRAPEVEGKVIRNVDFPAVLPQTGGSPWAFGVTGLGMMLSGGFLLTIAGRRKQRGRVG
jgi:LPXTG-motif cell wall-anchored protein